MKTPGNLLRRLGLGLLALGVAASAGAFVFILNTDTGLPLKWPTGNISLRIMLGTTPTLSDGLNYSSTAVEAAKTWNKNLGSIQILTTIVTGTPVDGNGVNEMGFSKTVFGRTFDPGVLAVTTGYSTGNERSEGDIIVNSAITWDSYRGSLTRSSTDLRRVAMHEMGHLLGLDHPDQKGQTVNAIMNSTVSNIETVTTDDIQGVQSLYGPPAVPANDNFANAFVLNLNGNTTTTSTGYNSQATKETGDPRQGDNPGGRSVWWVWTAPSVGTVTIDTGKENTSTHVTDISSGQSSYFDTTLGVYTGSSLSNLTRVADNDDINPGVVQVSRLSFTSIAGTTYYVCVDGYNAIEQLPTDTAGADSGGIVLNLAFTGSLGAAPGITTQPASVTVTSGNSASFSVVASGTAPLSYQWSFNGTAISGATASSYSISTATSNNAGNYQVVVSNQAGSVTSTTATLTVNPAPSVPVPSPSGGGGGGGGAPSLWFCSLLVAAGLGRWLRFRSRA